MDMKEYKGKSCRVSRMQIRETLFTVISMQGDHARETVDDKLKRLILRNDRFVSEKEPDVQKTA